MKTYFNVGSTIGSILAIGSLITVAYTTNDIKKEENQDINNFKAKIKTKDSIRYYNALEKESTNKRVAYWKNEYAKMQDSLRIDSLCKKAYFEGQQSIRDSLNKVRK